MNRIDLTKLQARADRLRREPGTAPDHLVMRGIRAQELVRGIQETERLLLEQRARIDGDLRTLQARANR
jgi:hypothetical protein